MGFFSLRKYFFSASWCNIQASGSFAPTPLPGLCSWTPLGLPSPEPTLSVPLRNQNPGSAPGCGLLFFSYFYFYIYFSLSPVLQKIVPKSIMLRYSSLELNYQISKSSVAARHLWIVIYAFLLESYRQVKHDSSAFCPLWSLAHHWSLTQSNYWSINQSINQSIN